MNRLGNLISLLLALVLLFALAYAAYWGFEFVFGLLDVLDKQLKAILIFSAIVVIVGTMIIASGIRGAKKLGNAQRLAFKRADIYGSFVETCAKAYEQKDGKDAVAEDRKLAIPLSLDKEIMLWASHSIVKHYMTFRKLQSQYGLESEPVQSLIGKILLEMRKDLGRENWTLKEDDFIELCNRGEYKR